MGNELNMSLGMRRHGIVSPSDPTWRSILATLEFLGPGHRFLNSGYPSFLKHLHDVDPRGFPWLMYEVHARWWRGDVRGAATSRDAFAPIYRV